MAQSLRQTLGQQIRVARTIRRWSQEALALSAGVNRTHIGAIERGELSTAIDTLEKIARALDISPCQLLDSNFHPPHSS